MQSSQLQMQLRQRDQVILELIERVETLEKQVGIKAVDTGTEAETAPDGKQQTQSGNDKVRQTPGLVVADESMAERALERSLTRAGVLLLPKGALEFEPSLVYARQEDATSAFVTSASGVIAAETERNSDSLGVGLLFRIGLPGDSQLEIGIPYRWRQTETVTTVNFSPIQTSSQTGSAAGDVRIALAKTLSRGKAGDADVIGRLGWDTDSGTTSDNGVALGGGYTELNASLSFIKRQAPVVFVSGLSFQHTLEKDSLEPGDTLGANFGGYLALNPQTSMNISLSMAYQQQTKLGGVKLPGTDRLIGSLYIGAASLVARGTLVNITLGIGLTRDANDFSLSLALPMRF